MDEDPLVYGLHSNAQIIASTQAVKQFLSTIINVQPRLTSDGTQKKPEEIVAEMAAEFETRVPAPMTKQDAHIDTFKKILSGDINSLGVFHNQEMDRFNVLIGRVHQTLVELGKALKGLVVMSAQLEEMYNCFLIQRLPPVWGEPVSYPCLKPLMSWFEDFLLRVGFIHSWLTTGPPTSFWVPCFYFPQGFMTCSKQVHARMTKIPIDDLVFWTQATDIRDHRSAPRREEGQNVHGFFLQGCGWSSSDHHMCESEKGEIFVSMPVIWLQVLETSAYEAVNKSMDRYLCPLYKTSLRRGTLSTTGHSTNFVYFLQLPAGEEDQEHWVRRGVAALCMLDD